MAMNLANPKKVVRVNNEEFELEDGTIIPHAIELDADEVPTVEEFQATYDHWRSVFAEELEIGQVS